MKIARSARTWTNTIDGGKEMENKGIGIMLEEIASEICDKYCKYPNEWDAEQEGMELCESDICRNCPLSRL